MKKVRGQHTWTEILSQPEVWETALDRVIPAAKDMLARWPIKEYQRLLFVGCGSTHYLSLTSASLARGIAGASARGLPSSELFLFPRYTMPASGAQSMLWAVSRSGETSETLRALHAFREHFEGPALTVGNYPNSTLVCECDAALLVPEGQEKSVAQTRSFSSMLLSLQVYLGLSAGDQAYVESLRVLPSVAATVLGRESGRLQELGADATFDTVIFLGSGPLYGVACEGMLKMKEMSLSHSEAYHFMEFRHGPKSIVNERTLIAALLSDTAAEYELKVLEEMRALGATVILICDRDPGDSRWSDVLIPLESGLPETARAPLCLVPLQLLAYGRSIARGLDPDQPANLSSVIIL